MIYFGASYGASDFGGNMYFNFALTSLVEIPSNLLSIDNCERYVHSASDNIDNFPWNFTFVAIEVLAKNLTISFPQWAIRIP